jgi:prepilin-type N-terminal cleavage/methylation domain-containing protein
MLAQHANNLRTVMFKQKGFTLIEILIGIVIVGILITVALNAAGFASGNSSVSWGINGATESRCIDGYRFIIGQDGNVRQVLSEFGKGVPCGNPDPGKIGSWGSR